MSEILLDATSILPCELEATGIEVCNRSAHCEGINGRQPHNLSTFLLLAASLRTGERALRVRFCTNEYGVTRTLIN
jgi:hypothetical protein